MKLNYDNRRKLLDSNQLSPIGLPPGVNLAQSCCQKVMELLEDEPMESTRIKSNRIIGRIRKSYSK